MAEDSHAAAVDEAPPVAPRSEPGKRRLDGDDQTQSPSSPLPVAAVAASAFEVAKQRAEEIAARLVVVSQDAAKRPRMDQDGAAIAAHDQSAPELAAAKALQSSSDTLRNGNSQGGMQGGGYYNTFAAMQTHKIDIPNGKVGVVIGKGGETIRHLQQQSGARIQITKDADHDPYAQTRQVELMGTSEQVLHAEQLINNVIIETDAGASGIAVARGASSGGEQIQISIPNNKVGLIIGRGGETIKSLQMRSGARIQLVPLEAPGETLSGPILERMLSLAGTKQQIDSASAMVKQILDQSNTRAPPFSGPYNGEGPHHPTAGPPQWGQPRGPPIQQSANNHQQAGSNNGYQQMQASQQYAVSQPPASSYSQQQSLGYNNQPPSYQAGGYNNQQSSHSGTLSTGSGQTQDGGLVPSLPFNQQHANYSQQVSTQPSSIDSQGYMQPQAYVQQNTQQNTQKYGQVQSHPNYNMNGQQSSVAEGYSTQQGILPPNYAQYPQAYSQQIAPPSQVYSQQGNVSLGYDQQGYAQQPAASQQLVYGQQGLNQQAYGMPPSNYVQQTMVPTQMYSSQGLTQQVYAMPGASSQQQSYMQQAYAQPGVSQPSINETANGSSQQQIANQIGYSSAPYSANNGQSYGQNLPIYAQSPHYSAAGAGVDAKAPPSNEYTSNPAVVSSE